MKTTTKKTCQITTEQTFRLIVKPNCGPLPKSFTNNRFRFPDADIYDFETICYNLQPGDEILLIITRTRETETEEDY